ncbi:MAG: M28 family metallopeptidase [Planctomycetota bacterium]
MNAPLHGLLATLSILLFACACTPAADTPAPDQTPPPVTPEKKQTPPLAAFDGARAWRDLGTMVAPGPRHPESPALAAQRDLLKSELEAIGLKVTLEPFESEVPRTESTPGGKLHFINLYADLPAEKADAPLVLLGSHMDTKFLPDFQGVNDGGSSTAALLELARVLAASQPRPVAYRFVFFDGEEAVLEHWAGTDNTYGSRFHAFQMTKRAEFERLKAFILLDMVGDKQLGLTIEENSTPALYRLFREAADQAGLGKHWSRHSQRLSDDHLPFLALGIPSIDLIDFEYGPDNEYWHSPEDTLEHCSQESLQAIGDIVRAGLVALEKKLVR